LEEEGLQSASLKILEDEMINNKEIFLTLTEAHFEKLLPLLKVGQHALLLNIWKKNQPDEKFPLPYRSSSIGSSVSHGTGSSRSVSPFVDSDVASSSSLLSPISPINFKDKLNASSINELASMYKTYSTKKKNNDEKKDPRTITVTFCKMVEINDNYCNSNR
jgi:hypothetical protein